MTFRIILYLLALSYVAPVTYGWGASFGSTKGEHAPQPDNIVNSKPQWEVGGSSSGGHASGNYNPTDLIEDPADPAILGKFTNNGQAPFKVTKSSDKETEAWKKLLERISDIIKNIDDAIDDVNKKSHSSASPITFTYTSTIADNLSNFNEVVATSTSVFNPAQPSEACIALSSIHSYCDGSNATCYCYSADYYVPDQWNSLAAQCANYSCPSKSPTGDERHYCNDANKAARSTSFCSSNVLNATSTAFGAVKGAAQTTSAAPSRSTAASTAAPTSSPPSSPTASSGGIDTPALLIPIFASSLLSLASWL